MAAGNPRNGRGDNPPDSVGGAANVTLSPDAAGALARLTAAYPSRRTRVTDPAGPLRRKPTDSHAPDGLPDDYGSRAGNTMNNQRNGARYGTYYKPKAEDLAGAALVTPPTTRISVTMTPRGGLPQKAPIRYLITENADGPKSRVRVHGTGDLTPEQWRLWALERGNLARDTGDLPVPGTDYPCGLTAKGNPAPSPASYLTSLDEHAAMRADRVNGLG